MACAGYLGHPFLQQENSGVNEEQGRGFSCRESYVSSFFPVVASAEQAARFPLPSMFPREFVPHNPLT